MSLWPALLALALAAPAAAAPSYAPRDDCAALPGAAAFRTALADAVARKDADALAALADAQVKLDFDDGVGRAELARRLTGAGGAELWTALADLLPLGCALDEGRLVLPWFFAQDLPVDDAYGVLLVTGEAVPLLPKGDPAARPVRLLSWALVEPAEGYDESDRPQPVKVVGSGVEGFVDPVKLRSPLDYRLIAGRAGSGWKIEVFIAGDRGSAPCADVLVVDRLAGGRREADTTHVLSLRSEKSARLVAEKAPEGTDQANHAI